MSEKSATYETLNEKVAREGQERLNREIEEIKTIAPTLENEVELMSIDNIEEMNSAGNLVRQWKEGLAKMEKFRLFLIKPIKDHVKIIEEEIKKTTVPVENAIKKLTDKILDFKRIEQQKQNDLIRIAEQKRIELVERAIKEQGGAAPNKIIQVPAESMAPIAKPVNLNLSVGGMAVKKHWTFREIDPNLYPRQYLKLDEVAVNGDIKKGVREIPGLEIYEKEILSR